MKRAIVIMIVIALALPAAPAMGGTIYGSGVTVEQSTLVSDIISRPGVYVGKTVKVKGLVVGVCTARGCWLDLAGDKPHEKIRVKVEDGAIVFPQAARGRQAAVQGMVEVMRMCPDEALKFRQNEARGKGVPFDGKTITGKETSVAILATGAVIE
jgi:hypothetical protein